MLPPRARPVPLLMSLVAIGLVSTVAAQPPDPTRQQRPGAGATQGVPGDRPRMPPRDNAGTASEIGTARIRGRVTDDHGLPLRRAAVVAVGRESRRPRTALTDPDGRFELTDLPGGTYEVRASKGGYVAQVFGQRGSRGQGRPIDLGNGQVIEKIELTLSRGGVVTGRVVDEFGEPMADASVTAVRYTTIGGRKRLVPAGRTAQTDDLGQFRVFGLPPGEYYVSARVRSPTIGGPGADPGPAEMTGYAPTFAPGTPNVAEAMRVTVQAGQEITADVQLIAARVVRVGGTVVSSTGPASGGFLRLVPKGELSAPGLNAALNAPIMNDGAFMIREVPPGAYTLTVRTGGGGGRMFGPPRRDGDEESMEFAMVPIAVAGDDVLNLRIVTSKGLTVPGVLVAEGGTLPTDTTIRITAMPNDPELRVGLRPATVEANGRFQLHGVGGDCTVQPINLPRGWMLKSVSYKGADITDSPVEFSNDGGAVRIVVTNRLTSVTGNVTGDNGAPLADYELLIFSANAQRWSNPARAVRVVRPAQSGVYTVEALPPGEYLVAAFDSVDEEARSNPEFLEKVRGVAQDVTLAEGQTRTLNLKLSATPQ